MSTETAPPARRDIAVIGVGSLWDGIAWPAVVFANIRSCN
jgi:hypothetical protein